MKKITFFPKKAILTLMVLLIIGMIMLKIIDESMPQYGSWTVEDSFINADRRIKMKAIKNSEYPLIHLKSSNLSQNENKKKIMIIGDSYIEGSGCSNLNQIWWRQLELELHDRGYYDVEVCAVGKDGASTQDEKDWLINTNLIQEVKPDLIIIGYVVNDPEIKDEKGNIIIKHTTSKNYIPEFAKLQKLGLYFPNIAYKINNMLQQKHEQETEYNDETGYPDKIWYSVITNETWSKVYNEKAVQPLGEYLNSTQIPSFVVTTPNGRDKRHEEWYGVLSLFQDAGIKVYNMFSEFQKMAENLKDKANTKINYVNGHPGTAYTKFYAEYVADVLEKDYKEVLGNKYEEKIEYPICINDWVPYSLNAQAVKEETDEVTYKITIPSEDNMLYMPIKEKYVKLSLEYPVSIKEIQLRGEKLKEANLYITRINHTFGYDDQTLKLVEKEKGNQEVFMLDEGDLVTSICIHTNMLERNELEITIRR